MIIIERMIQGTYLDKWVELVLLDQKHNVVEARLGFPAKKRSRCISGRHSMNTLIIERRWQSLAKMEAANEKGMIDPEYQALGMEERRSSRAFNGSCTCRCREEKAVQELNSLIVRWSDRLIASARRG